jgi:hypothetical protein
MGLWTRTRTSTLTNGAYFTLDRRLPGVVRITRTGVGTRERAQSRVVLNVHSQTKIRTAAQPSHLHVNGKFYRKIKMFCPRARSDSEGREPNRWVHFVPQELIESLADLRWSRRFFAVLGASPYRFFKYRTTVKFSDSRRFAAISDERFSSDEKVQILGVSTPSNFLHTINASLNTPKSLIHSNLTCHS